jgi:hypothetical protein
MNHGARRFRLAPRDGPADRDMLCEDIKIPRVSNSNAPRLNSLHRPHSGNAKSSILEVNVMKDHVTRNRNRIVSSGVVR